MNDPQTHPIATHFIMLHPTAISSFPSPTSKPNKIICTPKFNMERQKCWFWKKESPNSFWCHFQVQKGKNLHKKSRKNPILEYLFISILNFKPNFLKKKQIFFNKKKSTTNPPWSAGATITSFPSKCNPAHRSCGAIDTSSTSLPALPTSPYKASKRSQRWRRRSRSHLRDAPPRVFCCCWFLLKINGYPLLYTL